MQSDVYQAFLDEAKAGNAEAGNIIRPLRLIMPLYDEEIYFVARADSPLNSIHEIKDKKIGVGPLGSGTALTSRTLYQLMFGEPMPAANAQYLSNEEALAKLTVDKSIDVAIIVAGQPAKLFSDMKPEARKFIKILKLDDAAPETARARKTYFPATIRAESYSTWLEADIPTLTVKAYLVTYDYGLQSTVGNLVRFAESLCTNFDKLAGQRTSEVEAGAPGTACPWTGMALLRTDGKAPARLRSRSAGGRCARFGQGAAQAAACTEQELVLGICKR